MGHSSTDTKTALESLFDDDDDAVAVVASDALLPLTEQVKREMTSYKNLDKLPMTSNPLEFWKNHDDLPLLSRMAKTYFCVQATSVASERVFSTSGDIVSATRSCLTCEAVNSLVFLKKNMNCPK